MRRAVAKSREAARKVLLRHAIACVAAAAIIVFLVEPRFGSDASPLIANLAVSPRGSFYNQVGVVSAALLGFVLTAITILVSLDTGRRIVKELHYGEAFKLLIANMLVTVVLLFLLTMAGITGSSLDASWPPSRAFEMLYEWVGVATVFELVLTGVFFSIVTYKVAAYE